MMKTAFLLCFLSLLSFDALAQSALSSPNVSANGLFLYRNSNFDNQESSIVRNGIDVQEAEVGFYAEVDPYSRFNLILSIQPSYQFNTATKQVSETWSVEPEEAYAESNHIPATTIRVGKFKAAFGKHNQLHTHAFPLVDAPVANAILLGSEGLGDPGISAAVLLPVNWFSEFTVQYLRAKDANTEFNSPVPSDAVGLGHWRNLWDLNDALTMELGASYAQGNNSLHGNTILSGADLNFKWRPITGGKYHSGIIGAEYFNRKLTQPGSTDEIGAGGDLWGQYQFAERWSAVGRYDTLKIDGSDANVNPNALTNNTTRKYSAAVVFSATEFSAYRFELDYADGPLGATGETIERKLYLQANFTIGAHPAHNY